MEGDLPKAGMEGKCPRSGGVEGKCSEVMGEGSSSKAGVEGNVQK